MIYISIIILSLGLAMDAFAVSISCGISDPKDIKRNSIRCAVSFGLFQGAMTLIGFLIAGAFAKLIEPVDHWVAFVLLLFIGIKMLYEAISLGDVVSLNTFKSLMLLSVATSIDALAAGIGLAAVEYPILETVVWITFVTFVLSYVGVRLGAKLHSTKANRYIDIIGGLILIGLGIKILTEHLSV